MGLVAAASCEDYFKGSSKKHEFTRPDKEDDRVRHMEALDSQTGPVFLVYRANQSIDSLVARKIGQTPDIDFTALDKVRHTAWVISEPAEITKIEKEFGQMPCLYIADGHHRSAAAAESISREKGLVRARFSDGHFSA